MQKNIVIAGRAGFIGSHLSDELLGRGYALRVLDNLSPQVHGRIARNGGRPGYLHDGVELVHGDERDPDAVREALGKADHWAEALQGFHGRRKGDQQCHVSDFRRYGSITGRSPKVDFGVGLGRLSGWSDDFRRNRTN